MDTMSDRTTINVSKEAHREAKEAKDDDETWSDYLLRSTDEEAVVRSDVSEEIEELRNELSMASDPTVSPDVDGMMERIDEVVREVKKCQEIAEQARDNTDTITEGMGR